jgi:hypothetical protein
MLRKNKNIQTQPHEYIRTTKKRSHQSGNEWKRIWEGDWGDWTQRVSWSTTDTLFYACGATIRVESDQGNGDDTSMNGIKFIACSATDWGTQKTFTIHEGGWGGWSREFKCPNEGYINGLQVRYEDKIRGDNTAMNGLRFKCNTASNWITVGTGNWGSWKTQILFSTEPRKHICGGRSRFQSGQGNGDDTGMNGLEVELCLFTSELELTKVVFDYNRAIYSVKDRRSKQQKVSNPTSSPQTQSYTFEFSETETKRFESSESTMMGVSVTVGVAVEVGFLGTGSEANLEVSSTFENTKSFTFGKESSATTTETFQAPLTANPCTTTTVIAYVDVGETTIPYTMTLVDKKSGQTIIRTGTFISKGLGRMETQYQETPISGCPKK